MTTGLVPAETVNQQFINQGYTPPFTTGTYVNVGTAQPGTLANMVVTGTQAAGISEGKPWFGAFSTPDAVPDQQYVRSTLAITPAMKGDVSAVQPIQTTGKPMVTVDGLIAPRNPVTAHPGGGGQTFYDFPAGSTRSDYLNATGPALKLSSGGPGPQ